MNWFKKSQIDDAGAILYSMLVDAGDNPAKPLSVASRLTGATPAQLAQAVSFAYPRIMQEANGFLNESQQALLQEAQGMVNGMPPNQDQIADDGMLDQDQDMGVQPAEPIGMPQGGVLG